LDPVARLGKEFSAAAVCVTKQADQTTQGGREGIRSWGPAPRLGDHVCRLGTCDRYQRLRLKPLLNHRTCHDESSCARPHAYAGAERRHTSRGKRGRGRRRQPWWAQRRRREPL